MVDAYREYLRAELARLDLLLHREILRLRAAYQLSLDEFRGLYISNEQVDELVNAAAPDLAGRADLGAVETLTQRAEALGVENRARLRPEFPFARLAACFGLTPLEQDLLLIAAAPELDRKYEVLYAYLNNDVLRKQPNLDLATRLLGPAGAPPLDARAALLPGSVLARTGLLEASAEGGDRPGSLGAGFVLSPAATNALLDLPPEDPRTVGWTRFESLGSGASMSPWPPLADTVRERLQRLPGLFRDGGGPLLVFEGPAGSGRTAAARAVCARMGMPLFRVDLAGALTSGDQEQAARRVALQARLGGCALCLEHAEALFTTEGGAPRSGLERPWFEQAGSLKLPVFFLLTPGAPWGSHAPGARLLQFAFEPPPFETRRQLWAEVASASGKPLPDAVLAALADRFTLTPRQIQAAHRTALDLAALEGAESPAFETLLAGARLQAGGDLGRLAVKVNLVHTFDDLVLPPVVLQQVREVADAARNAHVVYYQWHFGRRFTEGRGLKVLFSGASGTGKTMTAAVIARELGLDLYKIDLSGVVSKYIGETEKNLDRVFEAATAANAILFFDEADALFGKRSEVKDAHDRYANIEVAYLLQKMESHPGMVVLATNLGKNIDEAFSRRMQYVVEFPLPDEAHRKKLWRGMFPKAAPLGKDVDFAFLARQFPISGGEIRNAVLEAAFLAASDGKVISMGHVMRAMARQVAKQGRLPSPLEFGEYYERVAR